MKRRANGEGSFWKRADGRWIGATYAATNHGGRKRVYVYGKTRSEARQKLTALQRELDRGVRIPEEKWSVHQYLDHWLEHVVKPNRAPKTYQGYELAVRLHIVPKLGKKRLITLSVSDVRQFVAVLEASGMSVRSVQQVHSVLRNALQHALRDEFVLRNVAQLVQVKTPKYEVGRGLSIEQARALLKATKADRFHALYVLAVYLGLRRGELLALRWSDIDLDEGALTVRHTLQRVGGELIFKAPKTRSSHRTIPLPAPCSDALKSHAAKQAAERLKAGTQWVDDDMVFGTRIGTPMEPDNISRSWYKVRKGAGGAGATLPRHATHLCQPASGRRCPAARRPADRRPQRDRRHDDDLCPHLARGEADGP